MLSGQAALAFSAGMVATVNPCGFAMLPAYLSFFVGESATDAAAGGADAPDRSVLRALAVSAMLTLGFILVFGVVGAIQWNFSTRLLEYVPYVTIVIGATLAALGVWLLLGHELKLRVPTLQRGGDTRELSSMFAFGVSYAVTSLGCTLGPFLAVVATSFSSSSFIVGVRSFVLYALGMGAVVTCLTVYLSLANTTLVRRLRSSLRYVHLVSGALLVLTGAYLAYYGVYEKRSNDGVVARDPIVTFFTDFQTRASTFVNNVGAERLGIVLIAGIGGALGWVWWRRRPAPAD